MTEALSSGVAAVILNWRRPQDTIACLRSVVTLDYGPLDVIVCDNDSSDGSIEAIAGAVEDELGSWNQARAGGGHPPFAVERIDGANRTLPPPRQNDTRRLCIVQTHRNGGYAFGNNIGIKIAFDQQDTDYAWVLNNDTTVDPKALAALVHTMDADARIGICGALVLYKEVPDRVQTLGGGLFRPSRARCEQLGTGLSRANIPDAAEVIAALAYVNGAAALVSRRLTETVGLMDEGYFLYFEEVDWAVRAKAAGFRLGYTPDAIVYHQVGAATGSNDDGVPSPLSTFYMERSRFRFLRKHRPWLLPVAVPLVLKGATKRWMEGYRTTARAMLAGAANLRFSA